MDRLVIGQALDAWRKLLHDGALSRIESVLEAVVTADDRMAEAEKRLHIAEQTRDAVLQQITELTQERDQFAARNVTARTMLVEKLREAQAEHREAMQQLVIERDEAIRLASEAERNKITATDEIKNLEARLMVLRGEFFKAREQHSEVLVQVKSLEDQRDSLQSDLRMLRGQIAKLMGAAQT